MDVDVITYTIVTGMREFTEKQIVALDESDGTTV